MRRPTARLYRDIIEVYPMGRPDPDVDADDEGNYVRPVQGPPTPYSAIVQPATAVGTDLNGGEMSMTSYDVAVMSDGDPGVRIQHVVTWVGHGFRRQLRAMGDGTPHTFGAWKFSASEVGPNPNLSGYPAGFTPEY